MELLVVITIIALLAAMLMPAIGIVRKQALSTHCANNLKMLSLATQSYSNDNEGFIPYYHDMGLEWYDRINPYIDDTYQYRTFQGNNAFRCPFATSEIADKYLHEQRFSFHYSINVNLYGWLSPDGGAWWREQKNMAQTRPGQVLYADGAVTGSPWGRHFFSSQNPLVGWGWDQLGPWPVAGPVNAFFDPPPTVNGKYPIVRHGGRVNQAYMDCHVAPVTGTWNATEQQGAR